MQLYSDILFASDTTPMRKLLSFTRTQVNGPHAPLYLVLKEVATESKASLQQKDYVFADGELVCRDDCGYTPLMHAAYKGAFKLVSLMIGQGASVHEASLHKPGVDAMDGLSPLHACCLGAEFDNSGGHDSLATAILLLSHGAIPFQEDFGGRTPFDTAFRLHPNLGNLLCSMAFVVSKMQIKIPSKKCFGSFKGILMIQPVFRAQPFARGVSMLERRPVPYLCCYNAKNKLVFKLPIDAVAVCAEQGSSQATLVMKDSEYLQGKVIFAQDKKVDPEQFPREAEEQRLYLIALPSQPLDGVQVMQRFLQALEDTKEAASQPDFPEVYARMHADVLANLGLSLDLGEQNDAAGGVLDPEISKAIDVESSVLRALQNDEIGPSASRTTKSKRISESAGPGLQHPDSLRSSKDSYIYGWLQKLSTQEDDVHPLTSLEAVKVQESQSAQPEPGSKAWSLSEIQPYEPKPKPIHRQGLLALDSPLFRSREALSPAVDSDVIQTTPNQASQPEYAESDLGQDLRHAPRTGLRTSEVPKKQESTGLVTRPETFTQGGLKEAGEDQAAELSHYHSLASGTGSVPAADPVNPVLELAALKQDLAEDQQQWEVFSGAPGPSTQFPVPRMEPLTDDTLGVLLRNSVAATLGGSIPHASTALSSVNQDQIRSPAAQPTSLPSTTEHQLESGAPRQTIEPQFENEVVLTPASIRELEQFKLETEALRAGLLLNRFRLSDLPVGGQDSAPPLPPSYPSPPQPASQ